MPNDLLWLRRGAHEGLSGQGSCTVELSTFAEAGNAYGRNGDTLTAIPQVGVIPRSPTRAKPDERWHGVPMNAAGWRRVLDDLLAA